MSLISSGDFNLKTKAIIVDLDGTLAVNRNGRSFFDESRVGEDEVSEQINTLVDAMYKSGISPIFVTGRSSNCETKTLNWLKWVMRGHHSTLLYMRKAGDMRDDVIVKREIYEKYIKDNYDILFVLDDRSKVVKMWRSLGLQCLQVHAGDF